MKELVDLITSGETSKASDLFEKLLMNKIDNLLEDVDVEFINIDPNISEALSRKLVVRGGKIKKKWAGTGGATLSVRGNQYRARRVQVDPKTGKRKEVNRSEAEVRKKVIDMKRRWKTTMRAKLPQILRKRERSSNIAKKL